MNAGCIMCVQCRYIFKGSCEKTFRFGSDDEVDQVRAYRKGRVTSASEAYWRLLGYPMFVTWPAVKNATTHEVQEVADGATMECSECVRYLFRPHGIDTCFHSPPTVIDFFERIQVVIRPPACVGKFMRQHSLQDVRDIPAGKDTVLSGVCRHLTNGEPLTSVVNLTSGVYCAQLHGDDLYGLMGSDPCTIAAFQSMDVHMLSTIHGHVEKTGSFG